MAGARLRARAHRVDPQLLPELAPEVGSSCRLMPGTVTSRMRGRGRVRPPRRQAARAHPRGARRARARGRRPRHRQRRRSAIDYPDKARELGEAILARRRRARRARLRLRRRRVGRRLQAAGDPRRDLPRRLLRAPGRRARRHERALPRLRGRRRRARRPSSCARSSRHDSTGGALRQEIGESRSNGKVMHMAKSTTASAVPSTGRASGSTPSRASWLADGSSSS